MSRGTVVLHHLSDGEQGQLDSASVGPLGTFSFPLPRAPQAGRGDVYFASVRHEGVLYFGPAVTEPAQLDSAYVVVTYDTLVAPARGASVPVQSRSVFFEPDTVGWRVTELFQLRNDEDRTLVTRADGAVWRHPLPAEALDVSTGEGELSFAAAEYEDGDLVVRTPVPPGERIFVVRYRLAELGVAIPNAHPVEAFDLLVREPAPPVDVPGLERIDRVELEVGSTYVRFGGADVDLRELRIVESEVSEPPRTEWVAFFLALVLGAAGLFVLRPGTGRPVPAHPGGASPPPVAGGSIAGGPVAGTPAANPTREALLHAVARLDEEHETHKRSAEEVEAYRARRAELIARIRAL